VATTTISLPDDQLARLQQHADASGRSLDEVVTEAVAGYLDRTAASTASVKRSERNGSEPGWSPVFRVGVDGMRVRVPPAMSPAEVDEYLAASSPTARREFLRGWLRKGGNRTVEPASRPPSPDWQAQLDAVLARIRARVPSDMTPDEIEALITEVSEEARQERIARRERTGE
jgi:hypothetical protein